MHASSAFLLADYVEDEYNISNQTFSTSILVFGVLNVPVKLFTNTCPGVNVVLYPWLMSISHSANHARYSEYGSRYKDDTLIVSHSSTIL